MPSVWPSHRRSGESCRCGGPLMSSRARWWERGLARMTSRRPFRCAYCYKRGWIIPDGSKQLPHSAQEIAAWPTSDVSFDLASLYSPPRPSGVAQVRDQITEVAMRKAGDVHCEVTFSITSSPSTAAVTSLHVRRPPARANWSRDWPMSASRQMRRRVGTQRARAD